MHYVVVDGAVQIVDASTGRIFSDRTWQDGLHQAIEAKEGVRITAEKHAEAQITRQRYFRLYERLCGMTGTAAGCEREFRQVYGLKTHSVPLRAPCQREILPPRFFANATAKWQAVVASVVEMHALRRPVLIGTRSIDDSERLADVFRQHALAFELLNGRQDAAEAEVVARAGQPCAITIATNLAGRGTDIQLAPEVVPRGGLHVVVAECHDSRRVDRQLIGRCARQGDPGSAQMFVSAEDSLIQRFGPWLGEFMQRHAGPRRGSAAGSDAASAPSPGTCRTAGLRRTLRTAASRPVARRALFPARGSTVSYGFRMTLRRRSHMSESRGRTRQPSLGRAIASQRRRRSQYRNQSGRRVVLRLGGS